MTDQAAVIPLPDGPPTVGPAAKSDKAVEKAWPSEARTPFQQGLTKDTRFSVYYSPKLMYLKVVAISARDLIPSEKGRPLGPTIAKIQMGGQIRRTKPQGSVNPTWNEEFMFVASEPLEDPLVVTVEEHMAAGRDESIGSVTIPVTKSMPSNSKWFSLGRGRLSLETEYHVLT